MQINQREKVIPSHSISQSEKSKVDWPWIDCVVSVFLRFQDKQQMERLCSVQCANKFYLLSRQCLYKEMIDL